MEHGTDETFNIGQEVIEFYETDNPDFKYVDSVTGETILEVKDMRELVNYYKIAGNEGIVYFFENRGFEIIYQDF